MNYFGIVDCNLYNSNGVCWPLLNAHARIVSTENNFRLPSKNPSRSIMSYRDLRSKYDTILSVVLALFLFKTFVTLFLLILNKNSMFMSWTTSFDAGLSSLKMNVITLPYIHRIFNRDREMNIVYTRYKIQETLFKVGLCTTVKH